MEVNKFRTTLDGAKDERAKDHIKRQIEKLEEELKIIEKHLQSDLRITRF